MRSTRISGWRMCSRSRKKNKQSNDPLAYVHSGWRIGWSCGIGGIWGKLFRKARGTYQTTPVHMGRIPDRGPMHSGGATKTHKGGRAGPQLARTTTTLCNTRSSRSGR